MKVIILILGTIFFSGCASNKNSFNGTRSGFGMNFSENSRAILLGMQAENRQILVIKGPVGASKLSNVDINNDSYSPIYILAEPPPIVAREFQNFLDQKLNVALKQEATGEIKNISKALNTIAQLAPLTQGVLWSRDFSYRLSEAFLNGAIDADSYKKLLGDLLQNTKELIEKELEHVDQASILKALSKKRPEL